MPGRLVGALLGMRCRSCFCLIASQEDVEDDALAVRICSQRLFCVGDVWAAGFGVVDAPCAVTIMSLEHDRIMI